MWQFLKNLVYPTSQSRHRATDCKSQVSEHAETGRTRFQNGFQPFEEGLSGEPPTHTVSWWNNL